MNLTFVVVTKLKSVYLYLWVEIKGKLLRITQLACFLCNLALSGTRKSVMKLCEIFYLELIMSEW